MNLNQVIHQLYCTSEPWITYLQTIHLTNPYVDSAYNNHITYGDDYIQVTIPEQIDIIHHLRTSWKSEMFLYREQTVKKITDSFLFNQRDFPICIRFTIPGTMDRYHTGHTIEFSATVFKKMVKNKLRSLL